MKILFISLVLTGLAYQGRTQNAVPTPEIQLKTAVLAAPVDQRDSATVYAYTDAEDVVLLRKGSNDLICLGDNPGQKGFSVACFHKDLLPFMQRGWQLHKEKKTGAEIMAIREKEVKEKKFSMPKNPASLTVFSAPADAYDPATGEVKNGNYRYVVYIAYATAASTGLPLKPEVPGMPWLMDPGTHRAHIMINPPGK